MLLRSIKQQRSIRLVFGLLLLLFACTDPTANPETNSKEYVFTELEMPVFTEAFGKKNDLYYHIEFLEDYYPVQLKNGAVMQNPLYGVYVLNDYWLQYRTDSSRVVYDAMVKVADACLGRMDSLENSLVFWYPKGPYVARAHKEHYSALTQSYYASMYWKLYDMTGKWRYKNAAKMTFESLRIPIDRGGVMYEWEGGVSVEEIPDEPNSFILNGWLSALKSIYIYHKLSGDPNAKDLFDRSTESLAKIIHLFDAEELQNSRYALSGYQSFKLEFESDDKELVLRDVSLEIPGMGVFPVKAAEKGTNTWKNYVEGEAEDLFGVELGSSTWRLNLVLNRLAYPEPCELVLGKSSGSGVVYLKACIGEYDALTSDQQDCAYVYIDTLQIEEGDSALRMRIDWEDAPLAAYPTNFNKDFGGKKYNVYHFIHIYKLRDLYAYSGLEPLQIYADKWEGYISSWSEMEEYEGLQWKRFE